MKGNWLLVLVFCGLPAIAAADLVDVGPFTGDQSENFSSFPGGTGGFLTLDIFGGNVTVNNLTPGGAVKIEFSSTLISGGNMDTVIPRSAPVMMGQLGVMEWVFDTPVSMFGGYFENNSFVDNVTFEFYDANNNLIGTRLGITLAASGVWTWNGWQSDVPIHRIVSFGHNATLLNGFIWYDDMEIRFATVPEPATPAIAGLLASFGAIVRRRSRRAG
jgi:hypothetical protein